VTRFVDDEKPLWVTTTRAAGERRARGTGGRSPAAASEESVGRVTAVGGASGDAVTAGIYVFPEEVRHMNIPGELGRLRDFLAWLAKSGEEIHAVDIPKVVDVDRVEDLAEAQALAALGVRGRV
jgi:NDP-sugar pyrophosphorylase family protein